MHQTQAIVRDIVHRLNFARQQVTAFPSTRNKEQSRWSFYQGATRRCQDLRGRRASIHSAITINGERSRYAIEQLGGDAGHGDEFVKRFKGSSDTAGSGATQQLGAHGIALHAHVGRAVCWTAVSANTRVNG